MIGYIHEKGVNLIVNVANDKIRTSQINASNIEDGYDVIIKVVALRNIFRPFTDDKFQLLVVFEGDERTQT